MPPQLDAESTTWLCLGAGSGATCAATGAGALVDNNVALPAGRSLSWLVTTSERSDAVGGSVVITVSASDGVNNVSVSDTLVILRSRFDVLNSDGAQGDGVFDDLTQCPADAPAEAINEAFLRAFTLSPATAVFDTLLATRGAHGVSVQIERATLGGSSQVGLIALAPNGKETASTWAPVEQGAVLTLAACRLWRHLTHLDAGRRGWPLPLMRNVGACRFGMRRCRMGVEPQWLPVGATRSGIRSDYRTLP